MIAMAMIAVQALAWTTLEATHVHALPDMDRRSPMVRKRAFLFRAILLLQMCPMADFSQTTTERFATWTS
jgi:hypothetical protein